MADVHPLRGIRYNPDQVKLGGVLAPPYDVISPEQREQLYGRDLRNIVRIDFGRDEDDDVPGIRDRYTRAAEHLAAWVNLDILQRDQVDSFYVSDHEFPLNGETQRRRGVFCRVIARPWEYSEVRPHERTLRGPKEDRMRLMDATKTQTSAVFSMWDNAPGIDSLLADICAKDPVAGGRTDGEMGSEKHLLWHVDDPRAVATLREALSNSTLYIADGHHRFETAAAYAAQQRTEYQDAPADADFEFSLMYLCAASSPAVCLLPTHRLVLPRNGVPLNPAELLTKIASEWTLVDVDDFSGAVKAAQIRQSTHHAFAVATVEGPALLIRPRGNATSPRAGLDVVVLETEILQPLGISNEDVTSGALAYVRNVKDIEPAVQNGQAALGIAVNAVTPQDVIAVADASEVMPQKSTYFYPKVPTGLVLSPL